MSITIKIGIYDEIIPVDSSPFKSAVNNATSDNLANDDFFICYDRNNMYTTFF